ncbi:ATP-binding protein [Tundrisphaera sp. TA3]|uniref:ATP-binding protein n=1 Tax=Tundrisphaera sp. TA3 TaxID=3435775 RepID=UPI003EBB7B23
MSETATLADHIDHHGDAILAVWRSTTEQVGNVPRAEQLSNREFVDHVPELLKNLADRLRGKPVDPSEAGQKHGQHRWSQGYDIAQVISELGHLRTSLIRATFDYAQTHGFEGRWLEDATVAINEVIDEAAAESARQYQGDSMAATLRILQQSEARKAAADAERTQLKTLLEHLPVGVWVLDSQGQKIAVNREGERLQGSTSPDEAVRPGGRRWLPLEDIRPIGGRAYRPEDHPLARALRGETILQAEHAWPMPSRMQYISVNAAPLRDAGGQITGAVAVVLDITARKTLENDLALSEAQTRAIVDQSPVMIWRSDASGNYDFFNRTWLEFRSRPLDDEAGEGWYEGIHPDDRDRRRDAFLAAFARREPFEIDFRLKHRDGSYRWVSDRAAPYLDSRGVFLGYLGSCLDITSRIELEERLLEQSRHKSRLMSALSHDARTPLNAVVLSADLLQSQIHDQEEPEVQESLRTIRNAVRNVLDLLSDLLDLTRLDAGATTADRTRFAIRPTLSECLSNIEGQARAKGLDVRCEFDRLGTASIETDRFKFKQIFSNLLSNALRYTERGHIRLTTERADGLIRFSVEDTGVGIAEQDQKKIFDEFAVLEHPNRVRGEGTGLGLAICRRLANLLGGEILLESQLGRGSTFTLAFPDSILCEVDEVAAPPEVITSAAPSGSILIAEDHAGSRTALAKVLRRMGYRVLEAGDGHDVLRLVEEEVPSVVLMDVNMPGLDGIETTLALRKDPRFRTLPIFALTGDVTIVNQQRIGEAGVDGYLEKPVTWEKLESALSQIHSSRP